LLSANGSGYLAVLCLENYPDRSEFMPLTL